VKPVTVPSVQLEGKARDFNWHNSFGFWAAPFLFFIVLTGVFMSYQWPGKFVDRWVGAPARTEGGPQGEGASGERRGGRSANRAASDALAPGMLDAMWQRAIAQDAQWKKISFRMPTGREKIVTFTIDRGNGRPDTRGRLDVDVATASVVKWQGYGSAGFAQSYRQWVRGVHTGTVGGIVGQTVAMLASLIGVVLVYTGLALAWRRFTAWRKRGSKRAAVAA
jgi:uncharacterized iron-regulated membrane protein